VLQYSYTEMVWVQLHGVNVVIPRALQADEQHAHSK
jgi:hypothetical protein